MVLLLLMMLKRALSIPSKLSLWRSEGRFFHQAEKFRNSGEIFEKAISHASSKKKRSPPPPSFGKEKRTKKTKAREKSTFDHRSRERERELKEIGLRSLFLRSTQHSY